MRSCLFIASAASLALVLAVTGLLAQAQLARRPQGFIGGVVQSGKGPEAGVWVIAEKRTRLHEAGEDRRDRRSGGASCCRSCRARRSRVEYADTASWIFEAGSRQARSDRDAAGQPREHTCRGGESLSGELLHTDARGPGRKRVPWQRRQQRDPRRIPDPGAASIN